MKILSDKKIQEKIQWKPHKKQEIILGCNQDEIVISAGRGFGKSQLCAYLCLKELLKNDKQILIVAPTYDLTKRVLEEIEKKIAIGFPSLSNGIVYRPHPSIKTPWGSKLECGSADAPTGILGKRFDLVIIDEAAKISRKVWETYIYPTTQITGGTILYISTPWGQNWFYEIWLRTQGFNFTSKDNPYFRKEDWERAKKVLPLAVFQQEHEAMFLSDAAAVFRKIDDTLRADCLTDVQSKSRYYTMGVDLGRHHDFTVLTVIDKSTNTVVAWERFKDIEYPFQKKRISALAKRYNNARIIIDSSNIGDPISSDLEREGLLVDEFRFLGGKSTKKKELIENLSIRIEQQKVFLPKENTILINELKAYGYELTASGRITYSAPQGLHDDAVISLALAVWGLDPIHNATKNLLKSKIESKLNKKVIKSYI